MTNLKNLSSENLLSATKALVAREREVTSQVLWHLREIEARRLFASLGFSSLFEYAVKDLGYSESSAGRRIAAMRLLKELPQIEEALIGGTLNLSHLSSAQTFFRNEKKYEGKAYSPAEKLEVLSKLAGTSQKLTEKILVALSPDSAVRIQERIRPIDEKRSEFKTVIPERLVNKLERVKELSAHLTASCHWAEILEVMADLTIRALDPVQKPQRTASPVAGVDTYPKSKSTSRYIPRALKKSVFEKADGQCEFKDPVGERRCSCRSFLQVDHITPLALGGTTAAENLRVLCSAHNQWEALQSFGARKMERHWRAS